MENHHVSWVINQTWAIFYSFVELPEGNHSEITFVLSESRNQTAWFVVKLLFFTMFDDYIIIFHHLTPIGGSSYLGSR